MPYYYVFVCSYKERKLLATWQLPDYRKTMSKLNHNLYSYNVEHMIFEVMGYFVLQHSILLSYEHKALAVEMLRRFGGS